MTESYSQIFRKHCRPLEPEPTDQAPVLVELEGIRAVLFDLYGTLFISASGEVGTSRESASDGALSGALEAVGIRPERPLGQAVQSLFDVIEGLHAASHRAGIEYPEVDIVDVWRRVVTQLAGQGILQQRPWERAELERLAVEYEARANPVWPMPGLEASLRSLSDKGLVLGVVSNGQFYTRELFKALLGQPAEFWGIDSELEYYSYQHGRGKPGLDLYQRAAEDLRRRGVEPPAALCLGNDVLNDVWPAQQLGFRTALYAGDRRSLRLRRDDPRVLAVRPDLILTGLADLDECILI